MVENIVNFIDTDFGKRPIEWSPIAISHIVTDFRGGAPLAPSDFTKMGFLVLPKGGIIRGGNLFVDKEKQQYCSFQYAERYKNNTVEKSFTIVVLRDLVPSGPNIGLMVRINNNESYLLAQGVYGFRVNDELVSPDYLIHISNTNEYRKIMRNIMVGSTQVHITNGAFLKQEIPLPPTLQEQTAIATALNDADALIAHLEKLIAKKKAMKQGTINELLRPKEGWILKTIEDCAYIVGGGTPSSFNSKFWNGNINWFTPTEVGNAKYLTGSIRKITEEGYTNCSAKILPVGTILLTSRAGIGDLGILKIEACTNQGFQSLIAKESSDGEFLYYLVGTMKNKLLQNASGSTFLEISPSKLKAIEVKIPDKKEQIRIAQILSEMDIEIVTMEKKLKKQKQLKQGMMQSLLTGKIRLV